MTRNVRLCTRSPYDVRMGSVERKLAGLAILAMVGCAKPESAWRAELSASDPFVRTLAAVALAELNPGSAQDALPVLLEAVDRTELRLGPSAMGQLTRMAPAHAPWLVSQLASQPFMTIERRAALRRAVVFAGEHGVAPLLAALRDGLLAPSEDIAAMLVEIGPAARAPLRAFGSGQLQPNLSAFAELVLARLGSGQAQQSAAGDSR